MRLASATLAAFTVLVAAARPAVAKPTRAPIVVTLVIDQMAAWIADERWPLLPATGGFARLRREGTSGTIVYDYAVSDTAPGHASLATGALPRDSGIFGNEIVDETTGKRVSILRDPATHVIAADGPRPTPSSSLAALRLPTLADGLRAAKPKATIVSLSLKDRGALFGGGRAPTATVWFDVKLGGFVTSSAMGKQLPAWAHVDVAALRGRVWNPLDRAFVAAHAASADAADGEGDLDGIGIAFPHALSASRDLPHTLRATPFADELLLDMAVAAVDAAPRDQPMLLAVSLSANDYIGHVFGPDSWEAWDELERLDATLARFFAALDARAGRDGWALVLAADHGVTGTPEARHRGGRILLDELAAKLRIVAKQTLGDGDWIAGVADPYIYLTAKARALPPAKRRALDDALATALRAMPGVALVVDARTIPPRCPAGDSVAVLVCHSIPSGAPGELYVALARDWFFDPDYVVGKGTSHGSAYLYDRAVPFVVRAPGRVAAGRALPSSLTPASYAATAAALLGVAPPPAARGATVVAR